MKNWIKAAAVRAVKTMAQSAIAVLPVGTIYDIDWYFLVGTVALAGILSVLTSIAGLPEVESEQDEFDDSE